MQQKYISFEIPYFTIPPTPVPVTNYNPQQQ